MSKWNNCNFDKYYDTVGSDCPVLRDLVVHVLSSVTSKWYDLGLVLLNPKYDNYLKTIETEEAAKGARAYCRKMFDKWLNTEEKAS